jgi:hypothetical protein
MLYLLGKNVAMNELKNHTFDCLFRNQLGKTGGDQKKWQIFKGALPALPIKQNYAIGQNPPSQMPERIDSFPFGT